MLATNVWDRVDCPHFQIEDDIMDLGDDGDGYIAYAIYTCLDCGTTSRTPPPYDHDE